MLVSRATRSLQKLLIGVFAPFVLISLERPARLERMRPHAKTHGGALLVLQLQLDKSGLRREVQAVSLDVTPRDRDGLDRLVDRLRPDGLDLDFALAS